MSRCVALCQELRWREATLLLRQMRARAERTGKAEVVQTLTGPSLKIEYSLRRQMAAGLADAARRLLNKEYLLDVGE